MTHTSVLRVTCDRCEALVGELDHSAGRAEAALLIDATTLELGELQYEDLCAACSRRVLDLLHQIIDVDGDPPEPAANADRKSSSTPSPATAAETPDHHGTGGLQMKNDSMFASSPKDDDELDDDKSAKEDKDEREEEDDRDE